METSVEVVDQFRMCWASAVRLVRKGQETGKDETGDSRQGSQGQCGVERVCVLRLFPDTDLTPEGTPPCPSPIIRPFRPLRVGPSVFQTQP